MVGDSLYFVQYLSVHLIKKCRSLSFIQFSFPESDSFDYCPIIMLQIGGGSGGGVGLAWWWCWWWRWHSRVYAQAGSHSLKHTHWDQSVVRCKLKKVTAPPPQQNIGTPKFKAKNVRFCVSTPKPNYRKIVRQECGGRKTMPRA